MAEELVIVDLRHSMDFEAYPETIPGAFRMDAKELEEKSDPLPRDRAVAFWRRVAQGVAAAMALGASAVQAGSAFLQCNEATTSAIHRAALQGKMGYDPRHTALTTLFTGRPARGIVNRAMTDHVFGWRLTANAEMVPMRHEQHRTATRAAAR